MENNTIILIAGIVGILVIPRIIRAIKQITPQKAKALADSGAVIVDVRESSEFRSGHIKRAINVPLNSISKIGTKASKDKDIIVYCQSGSRSSVAARQLKSMGYSKVYDLGSINKWRY